MGSVFNDSVLPASRKLFLWRYDW